MSGKKIFNDPVYGFVSIPYDSVFRIIEHPFFQRLRRIKQLGLTHYVYPGALHTRFQHAIGALALTTRAVEVLRQKGHSISPEEAEGVSVAILLHDIGHGPFSHALEHSIVDGVTHEELSILFMEALNDDIGGLETAIEIFRGAYPKKYLKQLVTGQLDMDRLDYLNRDSFFTGVNEGVIGSERIIDTLNLHNDNIVIDAKGIYPLENFIISRRLMYWQVYLHKTVIAAEQMLVRVLSRAKALAMGGEELFATKPLNHFLTNSIGAGDFQSNSDHLVQFSRLDDLDIFTSLKAWQFADDVVLRTLSHSLVNRHLFKIEMHEAPVPDSVQKELSSSVMETFGISEEEAGYLVFTDSTSNSAYGGEAGKINIMHKDGSIEDLATASDQLNISVLEDPVTKHYICFPKSILPKKA